jgi:CubicO group peptidase (beta-lactamase class C family)
MRQLIVSIISLLTVFTVISFSQQDTAGPFATRIQRIEKGLTEFTSLMDVFNPGTTRAKEFKTLAERMAHYNVPGVGIAVTNDFNLEWVKSYGIIHTGNRRPVNIGTYFQAASTSKLVTSAIVMHYVEKKILKLDEDVNRYLKSWKVPENDFTRKQKVTLRLLLTHQAGLPTTNFPQKKNAGEPTLVQVLKGESPALNKPALVEYEPGTRWQYSNIGYLVIQQVLEDVLCKPFAQIAKETLFEPLGMKHSTFEYPLKPEQQAKEAMPHDAEGKAHEPRIGPPAVAHGDLLTTPSDLALFTIELMRAYQGSRAAKGLLSKDMVRQMFRKERDLDPKMFGLPLQIGLGCILYGTGDHFVFAHPGSNLPGMNCWLLGYPETGRGIVIMTNGVKGEILALEIISAFNREYNK